MCGSPSVSSPYIVEPDFGADSRIWDDILCRWGDYSEYLLGRYAWTGAISPRALHLEPVSGDGTYTLAAWHKPYKPPIGRADQLKDILNKRDLLPQAPQVAPAIRQPPLLSQSQPATLYQQMVHPLAKTMGLGVTFDSSAIKPAPTDSQDTDICGRQATRGQGNGHRPASHPRGG